MMSSQLRNSRVTLSRRRFLTTKDRPKQPLLALRTVQTNAPVLREPSAPFERPDFRTGSNFRTRKTRAGSKNQSTAG